jgi:peptide/nickel transport system permease protein
VVAAVRRGSLLDYAANAIGLSGLSVPNFWLGLLLILMFAINLQWLPASGFVPIVTDPLGNLARMALPAFVLGSGFAAVVMRQMRSAMMTTLDSDFIRTARAKGLSEWSVVASHALRNSLITVVTVVGLQLGLLISGAIVTEQIFVIPGFGRLIIGAVFQRDYPVIQGTVLVGATGYIMLNLLVDVLYSVLNPRIRVTGAPA